LPASGTSRCLLDARAGNSLCRVRGAFAVELRLELLLRLAPETGQQQLKMMSHAVPLGRLDPPGEIARAMVLRGSDDSSHITGTELFVDPGVAQIPVQNHQHMA
jgi:NAD(P)-dependent dehydrogenase (short-subunit alcohol dehydrogenase family)